jgi:anti-anti-sigma factor
MPPREPLEVRLERRDRSLLVICVGEIGYQEAPALQLKLKESFDARPQRVVVDLSGVGYMSTPGVAALVQALKTSRQIGTPLILASMNDRVRAIFEIARLHTVFTIAPTVDGALA